MGDKMQILDFEETNMKIRCLGTIENSFVKEVFWFDEIWPPPSSKNDFIKIWTRGYRFRHVLRVLKDEAFELKPHLWNNDDMWKKIGHFKH